MRFEMLGLWWIACFTRTDKIAALSQALKYKAFDAALHHVIERVAIDDAAF